MKQNKINDTDAAVHTTTDIDTKLTDTNTDTHRH
jgi:hypothetical protein